LPWQGKKGIALRLAAQQFILPDRAKDQKILI